MAPKRNIEGRKKGMRGCDTKIWLITILNAAYADREYPSARFEPVTLWSWYRQVSCKAVNWQCQIVLGCPRGNEGYSYSMWCEGSSLDPNLFDLGVHFSFPLITGNPAVLSQSTCITTTVKAKCCLSSFLIQLGIKIRQIIFHVFDGVIFA